MRSTDEMRRLVQKEAAHRRSRRRALVSGGVGAIALVLLTAAVARTGTGDSAQVSTGTDGVTPAAPASPASTAPAPATGGTVLTGDESGDAVVVIEPDGSPSVTIPRSGEPRSSTTTSSPPADGENPTPTVTTERPPTSSDPTTTTTRAGPTDDGNPVPPAARTCTPEDVVRTSVQIFVPSDGDWTGGPIPSGHVVQFGYSTQARTDITPCQTPDSRQVLSITDSLGTEVFRHTYDGGPGRLITPGSWVMFRGSVSWDPSCATPPPPTFTWEPCRRVGVGSYTARLTDQGVVLDPRDLSIGPP